MSAWVLALGLSAGYLINKKMHMKTRIEESITKFNDDGATSEIRAVQRTVPLADKYQDMNLQDLSSQDTQSIVTEQERAASQVAEFENQHALPTIEGVFLSYDRHGV